MLANITFHTSLVLIVFFINYSATARSEGFGNVNGLKFEVALVLNLVISRYLKVPNSPSQHQFTWYEIRHVRNKQARQPVNVCFRCLRA